jgi:hypothetical protein
LLELKAALQATVVDSEYAAQKYKDKADSDDLQGGGRTIRTNKGATTRQLILDDADGGFWQTVTNHVNLTTPLLKMLRRFDTSAPAIGKVYSSWFEVGEHLKAASANYKGDALERHADRWAYGHADFAAAAYVLDPEFQAHKQSENAEVTEGFMNVVEKIAILLEVRKGDFKQAWQDRVKFLGDDPARLTKWDTFPKYPTDKTPAVQKFCQAANEQLTLYRAKKGVFSRDWVMKQAEKQPAYLWWDSNGASAPELQVVARLVLAQPASASICERINSEFAFVKDPRRNKLEHGKAEKLVAIFHNLRLIHRMRKPGYSEPAVGWNEDDNAAGVVKYGVAHYAGCSMSPSMPKERPRVLSGSGHMLALM